MTRALALAILGLLCTGLATVDAAEPRRDVDGLLTRQEGVAPKVYVTGGQLPKYCSKEEWKEAIEATVAATRDIPVGATVEFITKANQVAARFGC